MDFFFAEEDYSALEGELMPISVAKSMIIASPITLHINMKLAEMDLTGNVLDTMERAGRKNAHDLVFHLPGTIVHSRIFYAQKGKMISSTSQWKLHLRLMK